MSEHNRYSLERILRCRDGSNRARPRESDTSDSLTYARVRARPRAGRLNFGNFRAKRSAGAQRCARSPAVKLPGGSRGLGRTYFFLAVDFLAVVFFAAVFLAAGFLAAVFFATVFFAVVFFAAVFFAGAFLAVVFFAPDLVAALAIHPLPLRA